MEAFGDRKFQGKVWRISSDGRPEQAHVHRGGLDRQPERRTEARLIRARFPADRIRSETVKLIPARAVAYVFGSNKAYVVTSANTIEAREVKLGDRFDQHVEILEGVEDGEKVAVTQLARLDTGSKVAISKEGAESQKAERKAD